MGKTEHLITEDDLKTRRLIYNIIHNKPGIHFRELERETKLASGTLQYHLHVMIKSGLITEIKDGNYTRYYTTDVSLTPWDKKVLGALQRELRRGIILFILENPDCEHRDIVRRFKVSAPTITYHIKALLKDNILESYGDTRMQKYRVKNPNRVVNLLLIYRHSFIDSMIDAFLDAWFK